MSAVQSVGATYCGNATGLTGLDTTSLDFSLTVWVKLRSACDVYRHGNSSNPFRDGHYIYVLNVGGAARFMACQSAGSTQANSSVRFVSISQWCHLGFVSSADGVLFYRDGRLFSTAAPLTAPTVAGTRTTEVPGTSGGGLLGAAFDWRVFPGVALSPGEILATMDPRRAVGRCAGRWFARTWANGASVSIPDESGNGNNLTAHSQLLRASQVEEPPWREAVGAAPFSRARLRYPMWLKGAPAAGGLSIPFSLAKTEQMQTLMSL